MASIQVKNHLVEDFLQPVLKDRRSKVRFPLELRVRYRTLGRGSPIAGTGWVVNMSRSGVLVSSPHEIGPRIRVELNIEWPSLLDGRVPLQFVTVGTVVRREASSFAVVFTQYQFRTARKTVLPIDAPRGGSG